MGRRHHHHLTTKSHTLPSSPTHSSSSSDFEFTISLSPRKSSAALCPADELFYKGQLLPLHHHSRLSMVRTLLLSSPSTSSSRDSTTTASRDSTASHSSSDSSSSSTTDLLLHHLDCESSRPSSVAEDDELARLNNNNNNDNNNNNNNNRKQSSKYFSLSKFSSVFRKDAKAPPPTTRAVKRVSPKEVIRNYYLKKVKPLYEKLSQKHVTKMSPTTPITKDMRDSEITTCVNFAKEKTESLSFSGNLRYPMKRRSCVSSCPSSMRSSPSHAKNGFGCGYTQMGRVGGSGFSSDSSSMEELQSAIQGAIAHCKNSMMVQNKIGIVSNEI